MPPLFDSLSDSNVHLKILTLLHYPIFLFMIFIVNYDMDTQNIKHQSTMLQCLNIYLQEIKKLFNNEKGVFLVNFTGKFSFLSMAAATVFQQSSNLLNQPGHSYNCHSIFPRLQIRQGRRLVRIAFVSALPQISSTSLLHSHSPIPNSPKSKYVPQFQTTKKEEIAMSRKY
ncbi:hypothetical protein ACOSQ3_020139 [Xanthoceras sorbifolium]